MNKPDNSQTAQHYDDEISLIDLWQTLMRRKIIILATIVVVVLGAAAYLFVTPPTYEAKVRLLPPKNSMLALSVPDHPYTQFEAETVFQEFQTQLTLAEVWRKYVAANDNLFPAEMKDGQVGYSEDLPIKLSQNKNFSAEHVVLAYHTNTALLSANILRGYLQFARDEYVSDLVNELKGRIERRQVNVTAEIERMRQDAKLAREDAIERLRIELAVLNQNTQLNRKDEIERLQIQLAMLKEKADLNRKDQIARLRADLALAESLGITENQQLYAGAPARTGSDITIVAANQNLHNYMRGTRVLGKELDGLLSRDSDDPYIKELRETEVRLENLIKRETDEPYIAGLREKQTELDRLLKRESDDLYIAGLRAKQQEIAQLIRLQITPERFSPYTQDGEVLAPRSPIKPKKKLVLVLAILLGLMLGVLAAFFAEFLAKARQSTIEAPPHPD